VLPLSVLHSTIVGLIVILSSAAHFVPLARPA
jgi:hypothetical protein